MIFFFFSFNSLIQAQAKELSLLREQLKKSRDTCKHLQTEMGKSKHLMLEKPKLSWIGLNF